MREKHCWLAGDWRLLLEWCERKILLAGAGAEQHNMVIHMNLVGPPANARGPPTCHTPAELSHANQLARRPQREWSPRVSTTALRPASVVRRHKHDLGTRHRASSVPRAVPGEGPTAQPHKPSQIQHEEEVQPRTKRHRPPPASVFFTEPF